MSEDLEYALRRTLAAAAERAPKAPSHAIARPLVRRRRRQVLVALAAVTAVVMLIGGYALGVAGLLPGGSGSHPASKTRHLQRPKPTTAPPIEKVWPEAVHRVPDTLPGGRRYTPRTFIDDRTMLVSTEASLEKTDALYAYDLKSHTARQITKITVPAHTRLFSDGFTAGDGYVVWWRNVGGTIEIWGVPDSGGTARRIVSQPKTSGMLTRLIVTGGKAVWSLDGSGGVYEAPLTGGPPRLISGSKGMHILAWPWIGAPYGVEGPDEHRNAFEHVRNLRTGETRSARPTDGEMWGCGPTWCVGPGPGGATEAQRRDGTGLRVLPDQRYPLVDTPSLDRFVVTQPSNRPSAALYDLKTGRMGDLEPAPGKAAETTLDRDPANRLCVSSVAGGYLIVDLGAIH